MGAGADTGIALRPVCDKDTGRLSASLATGGMKRLVAILIVLIVIVGGGAYLYLPRGEGARHRVRDERRAARRRHGRGDLYRRRRPAARDRERGRADDRGRECPGRGGPGTAGTSDIDARSPAADAPRDRAQRRWLRDH